MCTTQEVYRRSYSNLRYLANAWNSAVDPDPSCYGDFRLLTRGLLSLYIGSRIINDDPYQIDSISCHRPVVRRASATSYSNK